MLDVYKVNTFSGNLEKPKNSKMARIRLGKFQKIREKFFSEFV